MNLVSPLSTSRGSNFRFACIFQGQLLNYAVSWPGNFGTFLQKVIGGIGRDSYSSPRLSSFLAASLAFPRIVVNSRMIEGQCPWLYILYNAKGVSDKKDGRSLIYNLLTFISPHSKLILLNRSSGSISQDMAKLKYTSGCFNSSSSESPCFLALFHGFLISNLLLFPETWICPPNYVILVGTSVISHRFFPPSLHKLITKCSSTFF